MNKEKLRIFGHLLAGFVILTHGWIAYDKAHPTSLLFITLGVLFLLTALFHKKLSHRFPRVDGLFFLIESIAFAATAYDYFHEHKKYLPWIMILVVVIYFVLSILVLSGRKKIGTHH